MLFINIIINFFLIFLIGIPELNIPSLEPFVIPEIDLKVFQGLSSSLFGDSLQKSNKSRAFTRNLVVHHSSEFQINSVK